MPEKFSSLSDVVYGAFAAVGAWLGYVHISRVPQKQFDEYKRGHESVHQAICDKMDMNHRELKDGQDRIEESISNLTRMFVAHLEQHE